MTALDMAGHIDADFVSVPAVRISKTATYVDGIPVSTPESRTDHTVTIQPASSRDVIHIDIGARRISDYRKIYINDGLIANIQEADDWEFDANGRGAERYETVSLDNRPWRNYCKAVVALYDE